MEKNKNFVLCGDKKKHLEIPDGYELVTDRENTLITKENIDEFKVANVHQYYWMSLDPEEDIGFTCNYLGDNVIRKRN